MNSNIEYLRSKASAYEHQFRTAYAACAPEEEINLLRSMWKLWAGQLAAAEAENDDTVPLPVPGMRFIEVNKTFDYFPEDDE